MEMPSGSYDRAVLIWDICKGNEFAAVMLEPAVDCISSREEEQLVVAADRLVNICCLYYNEVHMNQLDYLKSFLTYLNHRESEKLVETQ
jgi:hypothetical protein